MPRSVRKLAAQRPGGEHHGGRGHSPASWGAPGSTCLPGLACSLPLTQASSGSKRPWAPGRKAVVSSAPGHPPAERRLQPVPGREPSAVLPTRLLWGLCSRWILENQPRVWWEEHRFLVRDRGWWSGCVMSGTGLNISGPQLPYLEHRTGKYLEYSLLFAAGGQGGAG